ncbi:MAG: hypothetical protein QXG39_06980 [Candidatus Aenigmatarchaeota archaeon]
MKVEQKIVLIYMLLGMALGFFTASFLDQAAIAFSLPFFIYFSSFPISILLKIKKFSFFYLSFITFIMVWLTSWILLYNLVV